MKLFFKVSNFKQPLLGSVKVTQVFEVASSADRAELAISYQLFRFT